MPFVVGLDLGTRYLKGVVLAGTRKSFRLVDFFMEETPSLESGSSQDLTPPSLEECLAKIFRERRLEGADVVAAIEAKDCVLRQFPIQFTRDDQIRKVIGFAAEEHFPAFGIDEVVLEYLKIGESNGKSQLLVAALRNDIMERRLATLARAGIDPVAMDLDCAALVNAFALTKAFDPGRSTLLADLGAASVRLVHLEGGKIRKMRSFRMAAAPARERTAVQRGALPSPAGAGEGTIEGRLWEIESALGGLESGTAPGAGEASAEGLDDVPVAILSDEDFARILEASERDAGKGGQSAASEAEVEASRRRYFERIAAEIHRMFAASRTKLDLLCLTGGLSAGDDALEFFSEEFGAEAVRLDLQGAVPSDLSPDQLELVSRQGAVALGLAVKEFGRDLSGLDFRKGRFRYERRFNRLRFPLLLVSVLACLFFAQTFFWSYYELQRTWEIERHLEAQLADTYQAFFGKPLAKGRDPLMAARNQKELWEKGGVGDVGRAIDAVEAIRNIGEILRDTKMVFEISSMNLTLELRAKPDPKTKKRVWGQGGECRIELVTKEAEANTRLEEAFKDPKSRIFNAKASLQGLRDGTYKVTLDLSVKPEYLASLEKSQE